jgi:hypothetical protein
MFLLMERRTERTLTAVPESRSSSSSSYLRVMCCGRNWFSAVYDGLIVAVAPAFERNAARYLAN